MARAAPRRIALQRGKRFDSTQENASGQHWYLRLHSQKAPSQQSDKVLLRHPVAAADQCLTITAVGGTHIVALATHLGLIDYRLVRLILGRAVRHRGYLCGSPVSKSQLVLRFRGHTNRVLADCLRYGVWRIAKGKRMWTRPYH